MPLPDLASPGLADLLHAGATDPSLKVIMGTSLFLGGLVQTNDNCLHLKNRPGKETV